MRQERYRQKCIAGQYDMVIDLIISHNPACKDEAWAIGAVHSCIDKLTEDHRNTSSATGMCKAEWCDSLIKLTFTGVITEESLQPAQVEAKVFKRWFAIMLRVAYSRQSQAGHLFTFRKFDEVDIAFTSKHDKALSDLLRKAKDAQDAVDHYILNRAR